MHSQDKNKNKNKTKFLSIRDPFLINNKNKLIVLASETEWLLANWLVAHEKLLVVNDCTMVCGRFYCLALNFVCDTSIGSLLWL
mmetsp:Transcript_14639/g.24239  ORF Transcript_14639/g.24239 Transcript_14639/m.24239 type:complete len:84 (+) Transcript_14639:1068-1319(+)